MSESLTRSLLAITTAKTYLEDVIREYPAMQRRVNNWINKLSFVSQDALCIMTPAGRETYRRELIKGDHMQFEHIFRLLSEMNPGQRNLIEKASESLLKGELQIETIS